MKHLKVLCDADDTIENLMEPWANAINNKFKVSVNWRDIDCWNVSKFFPMLTREQVYSPIYDNVFWESIEPMPGAEKFIHSILNDGHELYIITATNYQTCGSKIKKILEMFPELKWENFIIATNKQLVNGDILIDDAPHNLVGGSYRKVLFDRPHNHKFNEKEAGIKRVFTLEEAYWEVRKLAEN